MPRVRNRTGKVPVKLALFVVVVGGLLYYGIPVVGRYIDYVQMKDEMGVQARFAANQSDDDIRRKLRAMAAELGLPKEAQRFSIRRRGRPREITITTSWPDTIVLPFYRIPITYAPEARAPL